MVPQRHTMLSAGACRVLKGDYIRDVSLELLKMAGACRVLKGDYIYQRYL